MAESLQGYREYFNELPQHPMILEKDGEITTMEKAILINPQVQATVAHQGDAVIILKQGARLKLLTQGSGRRTVVLEQDSHLDWIDVTTAHSSSTAHLLGNGADAKFRSLFVATDNEQYDVQVNMIHKGSHTRSHMLTRAVLLDASKGRYRGLIKIDPHAKGCDAHQREDTLLLGDHARMDATPVLEIENNEVKCSHGVTLGQVDEEQLFYLASRGIPREMAIDMLVQGFFDQLLISMGEYGHKVRAEILAKVQHA